MLSASLFVAAPLPIQADDGTTSWLPEVIRDDQLQLSDVQDLTEGQSGFQRFLFRSAADFQACRLEAPLPDLLPVEEFVAETRVNSTHAGIRLAVRLVLPGQIDPQTDQPLTTWLLGNRSEAASEWQTLRVTTTQSEIETQLIRVRAELAPTRINTAGLYIDRCGLVAEFSAGDCAIDVEPVTYGPIVHRPESGGTSDGGPGRSTVELRRSRVRVERSQVFLDDQPTFLLMMPDHGETLQEISRLGVNTLWTHDFGSVERLSQLSDADIMIAATPPHPGFDPLDFQRPLNGLMPLERQMEMVDLIYLGTRVTPGQLPHLLAWARLVRSADRQRRRPIMADVIGSEGLASRRIDMVGIGVPAIHRNLTFGEFRGGILYKRRRASQMTLPWTWVQTESPTAMTRWRAAQGLPPLVVEPEQITMQVVAALSAGVRAIAFWKTASFGGGQLDDSEAGLSVALSVLHIKLLEPWLVSGQTQSYIAVDDGSVKQSGRRRDGSRLQQLIGASPVSLTPSESAIPRRPDAAVISGRNGSLILVAVWDDSSQLVPGHLYARQAKLIATARETSSASQVTATGVVGQRRTDRPGGLEVTLKDLDQFGIILVSSDPQVFSQMSQRVQQVKPAAAALRVQMGALKYQRVLDTCVEIDQLTAQPPASASRWLKNAERQLKSAQSALQSDRFAEADRQAQGCLRSLRAVQNLYWKVAIQQQPTPMASPFTIAFSSLPEHWRMMQNIQASEPSENLLLTDQLDRRQIMEQLGWRFPELAGNIYATRSQVHQDPQAQTRVLQLAAWKPATTQPPLSTQPSTVVNSPSIQVQAGDIVEIRGRVRLSSRSIQPASEYPFMVFDSELGPEFSVRPALDSSWRSFHMYRQVASTGPLQISFGLHGSAEVHMDLDALTVRTVGRASLPDVELRSAISRYKGAGHSYPSLD